MEWLEGGASGSTGQRYRCGDKHVGPQSPHEEKRAMDHLTFDSIQFKIRFG